MTDETIHAIYKEFTKHIRWHDFREVKVDEPYFDWYYAENRLYIIRDRLMETYFFVEARSPAEALKIMNERARDIMFSGVGGNE